MKQTNFRVKKGINLNVLFSFSCVTLALLGILTLLPPVFVEEEIFADINPNEYSVSLVTESQIALNFEPTAMNKTRVTSDHINVTSTSPAGYKLYVSTTSEDTNSILLGGQQFNDVDGKRILATSGTYETPTTLSGSTWGYAVPGLNNFDASYSEGESSGSKFAALPTMGNEQLIRTHRGVIYSDNVDVYYGANVDTHIANGNYLTQITYTTLSEASSNPDGELVVETEENLTLGYENKTATAQTSLLTSRHFGNIVVKVDGKNATDIQILENKPLKISFTVPEGLGVGEYPVHIELPSLGVVYDQDKAIVVYEAMQAMTEERCRALELNKEYKLVDLRDNKTYLVSRLEDGNCWMTQNLDLDLSADVELDSVLTDLNYSPEYTQRVYVSADTAADRYAEHNAAIYSYIHSDNVKYWTPSVSTIKTKTIPSLDGKIPQNWDPGEYWFKPGITDGSSGCTKTDFSNCSVLATAKPVSKTNTVTNTETPLTEDGDHYKIGNYYNWAAATATNASTTIYADGEYSIAGNSICPRGWTLPNASTRSIPAETESIYNSKLGELYYQSGLATSSSLAVSNNNSFSINHIVSPTAQGSFYAVPGGFINTGGTATVGVGQEILYWTSTLSDNLVYAKMMRRSQAIANFDFKASRNVLTPLRCVVRFEQELKYDFNGGYEDGVNKSQYRSQKATGSTFEILPDTIPDNGNKTFLGWSEDKDAEFPTYVYDTETQTFNPSTITTTGTTLYAIWADRCNPEATTIEEAICMQDMNDSVKESMTQYAEYKLLDSRDLKSYYITKLSDGSVWMTQNLDLDFDSRMAFNDENTDLNKVLNGMSYTNRDNGAIGFKPSKNSVNAQFTLGVNNWTQNNNQVDNVWNPGNYYLENGGRAQNTTTGGCAAANYANCATTTTVTTNADIAGDDHYKIGNYYNWAAAVATTQAATDFIVGTADATQYPSLSSVENSICPKGWRLPQSRTDNTSAGEASKMLFNEGITTSELTGAGAVTFTTNGATLFTGSPIWNAKAGEVGIYNNGTNASIGSVGVRSRYWTSTIVSTTTADVIRSDNSTAGVYPQSNLSRQYGFSVRCIAR